jgi:acetyl-CoA C-acetyltransferase
LVWANGGFVTKHAFGVYSTVPVGEFRYDKPQSEIDALPRRELAAPADAVGTATIEAYTVMFDRDGSPDRSIAACLLGDGRRAWGTSDVTEVTAAMSEGEWVGRSVDLDAAGDIHLV